ncbi:Hypp968 [Branchiostoma lanceolatum]|uniref:Hypp968 protein n=1 Tax=Branchiostoma lanceolatum TaxID=7740 RepID=A0A8K0EIG7_BRALA|nr:Hypp968 [Branchiostoma lanceolatum]
MTGSSCQFRFPESEEEAVRAPNITRNSTHLLDSHQLWLRHHSQEEWTKDREWLTVVVLIDTANSHPVFRTKDRERLTVVVLINTANSHPVFRTKGRQRLTVVVLTDTAKSHPVFRTKDMAPLSTYSFLFTFV